LHQTFLFEEATYNIKLFQLGDDVHLVEEVLGRLARHLGQLDRHLIPAHEAAQVRLVALPFLIKFSKTNQE
jgi:hypothetical protein